MYKYIVIQPDGTVLFQELNECPQLEDLQVAVGGWIEHISLIYDGRPAHGYVNEAGKLRRLPLNKKATAIYHNQIQREHHRAEYQNLTEDPDNYIYYGADWIRGVMVIWTGPVE